MKITEVSLGFPVNMTIETQFENYAAALTYKLNTSYNYKLIIHCTEEQRKQVSEQSVSKEFIANNPQTASVKVIFDVERSQHIRSPQIIHAKTNCEKLAEYLRVNEITTRDNIYSLEKEIEDNLEIKYTKPRHSFTLLKVFLRGSIGLHEKSGREEFAIDFDSFPDGIIAMCAKIGSGKSTLIENCQPYPQMLTRSGKLQDHFFLRDSCRKLLYKDEEGTFYDIDLQIDGKNKSGKVKAFVKTGKSLSELKDIPECDGNIDSYTKWVNDTFGPIELYLRTAFYTKGKTGSVPDIAYASKGEKKSLFSTLIGIDRLSEISLAAHDKEKELEKEIDKVKAKIVDLSEYESVDDIDKKIKSLRLSLKKTDKLIEDTRNKVSELEKVAISDVAEKIKDLEIERDKLCDTRLELEQTQTFLNDYNSNKKLYGKAENLYTKLDKANKDMLTYRENTYEPTKEEYQKLCDEITEKKHNCEILKTKYDAFAKTLNTAIEDTCPTCGQKLPESKIAELKSILADETVKLKGLEFSLIASKNTIMELEAKEKSHVFHEVEKSMKKLEVNAHEISSMITDDMPDEYDIREVKAKYLAIKSPETISQRLSDCENEITTLTNKITELSKVDNSQIINDITSLKEELSEQNEKKNNILIEVGSLTEQKKAIIDTQKQNDEYNIKVNDLNSLQAQYNVLYKAFGANGIQALELEALSPEIADITNNVLETVFGGEYKISFQTLRVGSSGNLIEDFNILVETVSTGTVRPLEWLSGGESTIIKEALYNAFSIARQKSSGFSFRTKFMDEMDSAIDPEFRPKYLQMVKAVHEISGTRHTVMITHSSEIKDAIESKIEL